MQSSYHKLCRIQYHFLNMEMNIPSNWIADIEPETALQTSTSTHAERIRGSSFKTPAPVPKRFESAWDHLIQNFPCPPELQHRVWASTIRRMFAEDCGFPVYWTCDCNKCVKGISNELSVYFDASDVDNAEWMAFPVDTLSIWRVTRV